MDCVSERMRIYVRDILIRVKDTRMHKYRYTHHRHVQKKKKKGKESEREGKREREIRCEDGEIDLRKTHIRL